MVPAIVALLLSTGPSRAATVDTVYLRGHSQLVRLFGTPGAGVPVIVSSGDGGWIHLGPHVAEALAARGYFVIGFDTRAYLSGFTAGVSTLRPEDVAADYRELVRYAARGSPVRPVLVGVSEGAGLSVLAAADDATKSLIGGVVAIGLPDLNELGWRWKDAWIYVTHGVPNEPTFSSAAFVGHVSPLPLAVIHSTRDEFVTAAQIQSTMDRAAEPKQLWMIDAADHRFSNNLPELDRRLQEAISWVTARARQPSAVAGAAAPSHSAPAGGTRERVVRALPALIGLVLFVVALEVLRRELHAVSWRTLSAAIAATPAHLLLAAGGLTAINYAVLTAYDFIALRSIGRRLPSWRVGGASFLAYAIANNVGFAMVSGASVRYRFYTRWGLTAAELSGVVISYSVTFWLGLLTLSGITLVSSPLPNALGLPAPRVATVIGVVLLAASAGYVVAAWRHRAPLRIGGFELRFPSVRLAVLQVATSSVEWALAAAVVYVLLPPNDASFVDVLGAFLLAQVLGLAAHVPGGVGVFEGLMVLLLKPFLASALLVPALVVYRVVYYAVPLAIAVAALVLDEVWLRRAHAVRAAAFVGRLAEQMTPRLLAGLTFAAGMILLFSGATPAAEHRLAMLHRLVPLGIIETSHVIGSVTGAVLLLLSQGLARRLDAAYYLTVGALTAGMVASLLRAGGWEEALTLGVLLVLLRRARPAFTRTAALFATRFSAAWIASVVAVVAASVWLGFFAFKHVEYSHDLWWHFALNGDASRFLRGTVGATTVVLLFAIARLIGHAPAEVEEPSSDELSTADAIIKAQPSTYPNLVYLRDKAILFDEAREAFILYGVRGRTWVALKDPVGPAPRASDLIRLFIERCDDFGGTPVFYEVGTQYLHHYADFGFTTAKIGEEARVDLAAFTLDGPRGARYRQVTRRFAKDGCTFRVIAATDVATVLRDLAGVSDDWLREKAVAEKGFSVGYFDRDYLARFPAAIVERDGRIVAFATLWPGGGPPEGGPHVGWRELSIDLMRYHHDAPNSVMEALIVHAMIWGQSHAYDWFSLGTAPMSGFEASAVAPLRARAGHFLYQHGARLYNFQGLRAFKEKFDPVWESRYLVYPGGLRLPRIAADVSALIAGGYRRIFSK